MPIIHHNHSSQQQRDRLSPTTPSMDQIARPDPTKSLHLHSPPPITAVVIEAPSTSNSPRRKSTESPGCRATSIVALEDESELRTALGTMNHQGRVVHLGGTLGLQSLQQRSTFDETCSDLGDLGSLSSAMNLMPGQIASDSGTSPAARSHDLDALHHHPTRVSGSKKATVRFTPNGWKGSEGKPSPPSLHLFPDVYNSQHSDRPGELAFIQDVVAMRSQPTLIPPPKDELGTNTFGQRLAQVSSGHRLKPSTSYRRRSDELSSERSERYQHDVTMGTSRDDPHAPSDDAATDITDLFGGSNTSAYERRRHGLRGIPFWVKVCVVMAIPLCFLVVYLSLTFSEALRDYNYVQSTSSVIEEIISCTTLLQRERRFAALYQLTNVSNSLQMFAAHDNYVSNQHITDASCVLSLPQKIEDSPLATTRTSDPYAKQVKEAVGTDLGLLRFSVDRGLIDTTGARKGYGSLVATITDGISVIAKRSVLMRRYLQLKAFRIARDATNLCGVVGVEVLRQRKSLRKALLQEMNIDCMVVLLRSLNDFRIVGGAELRNEYLIVSNGTLAQLALTRFAALAGLAQAFPNYAEPVPAFTSAPTSSPGSPPAPSVAPYPWQRDTGTIPPIDFNETVFNNQRLDYSILMDAISLSMLNALTASADLRDQVRNEAIKLFLSLIASLIGIALVSRAQRKSSEKVEFALSRTREMSRAVGAFVPRSFLKLMGVDSILYLQRGDQTEVSVALLFCDIRNFTGISEHMTNEELFEWLQAHLTRMTTTTERHHGFVDKFIGDAVSSVFLDSSKAVQCAIRMQTVTDALCYELIAENEDHLVKIGVGIHYATVGVGVLGNDKHHSCSIVSSEIAVPAQLEALTKEYGARILITEQVAERLRENEFDYRLLGRVRLSKSSTKEYQVYEIYNADSIEQKTYKKETGAIWDQLLRAQKEENFALVQQLSQELAQAAQAYALNDPAALLKSNAVLPYDQFDM